MAVWKPTNVSSYDTIEDVLTVPVPPSVRKGVLRDLWLTFEIAQSGSAEVHTAAQVNVIGMYKPRELGTATMLLERDVFSSTSSSSDGQHSPREPSTTLAERATAVDRRAQHASCLAGLAPAIMPAVCHTTSTRAGTVS